MCMEFSYGKSQKYDTGQFMLDHHVFVCSGRLTLSNLTKLTLNLFILSDVERVMDRRLLEWYCPLSSDPNLGYLLYTKDYTVIYLGFV